MSTAIIPFPKRGSMGQTEPEDEMCSALGVQKFLYQNNMSPQKTENKTSDLLTASNRSMRKQCQVKHIIFMQYFVYHTPSKTLCILQESCQRVH